MCDARMEMNVQLETTWLNGNSDKEPTWLLTGHQHTDICDRPVGVIQQTGINPKGETMLGCLESNSFINLRNRWIFDKDKRGNE